VDPDCPPRGYLGHVVVRVETGRRREWSEGSQALLLTDERAGDESPGSSAERPRRRDFVAMAPSPEELGQRDLVHGIVTWKPTAGHSWKRVTPTAEQFGPVQDVVKQIFDEAGWPPCLSRRPLPSLWRLDAVDVRADAVVEDLPERNKKSKRVSADFQQPQATALSGGTITLGVPRRLTGQSARIALPSPGGEEQVWRVEVPTKIRVTYRDGTGQVQDVEAAPPDEERGEAAGRWTFWTHALGSEPQADWISAANTLCGYFLPTSDEAQPITLPAYDLKTVVQRAVKDDVVTVTELVLMVKAVRQLCGNPREGRTNQFQARSE
jgi:hypothetical protein